MSEVLRYKRTFSNMCMGLVFSMCLTFVCRFLLCFCIFMSLCLSLPISCHRRIYLWATWAMPPFGPSTEKM